MKTGGAGNSRTPPESPPRPIGRERRGPPRIRTEASASRVSAAVGSVRPPCPWWSETTMQRAISNASSPDRRRFRPARRRHPGGGAGRANHGQGGPASPPHAAVASLGPTGAAALDRSALTAQSRELKMVRALRTAGVASRMGRAGKVPARIQPASHSAAYASALAVSRGG